MHPLDATDWFVRRHIGPSPEERDEMLKAVPSNSFDAYATFRQIRRYAVWWWKDEPAFAALPQRLLDYLRDVRRVRVNWDAIAG